jgi:hypothetical protein
MAQAGQNKPPIGGGAQEWGARPATEEAPQVEVIERGVGHVVYRERRGGAVRLIARHVDREDDSIYSMNVVEIDNDMLRIYTRWSLSPERQGERLIIAVRLEPHTAEKLRNHMLHVSSALDFLQLMWELESATYHMTPDGAVAKLGNLM